ncbi:beta-ketoacyl-ACP synthase [Pseudoalteromonas pernae]|uniref:beta-ketoacyl-ACP synthase n=1 Tax=Pseudoalteromonas pernae TaxID=3118054 RepID=UPI0032425CC7
MKAWLNDVGIVSALGTTKSVHLEALASASNQPLTQNTGLSHTGCDPFVGKVAGVDLNTTRRNNQIIDLALTQLQPTLAAVFARYPKERIAVVMGTSTADIYDGERARAERARTERARSERARADKSNKEGDNTQVWPQGYHYHHQALDAPAQYIKARLGLQGLAYSISTACSSSAKALSSAKGMLEAGLADVVICGGADSLCQLTVNGFAALASTSEALCRPFAADRDGINIGEGAAIFVMSKERSLGHASTALIGCGASSDAYHMSAPEPTGEGAQSAMHQALADAGIKPQDVEYLNAHGTATPKNDEMEAQAIARVLGCDVPVSSTKHWTGHTLGAAGAIEAAICWLLIEQQRLAVDLPLLLPKQGSYPLDDSLQNINIIQKEIIKKPKICMSNSFAFGGNNACLILGEVDA